MRPIRITIVDPTNVGEDKKLYSLCEDWVEEVDTLPHLAQLMCISHILPAVFKEIDFVHDNKPMRGRRRKSDNVEGIDLVGFDFDEGTMVAAVKDALNTLGCSYVILGSKNHMKDKGDGKGSIPRFHVFIPLSATLTSANDYRCLWTALINKLGFTKVVDTQPKDITRYYFQHSVGIAGKNIGLLNPEPYIRTFKALQQLTNFATKRRSQLFVAKDELPFEEKKRRFLERHKQKSWITNINTPGMRHASSLAFSGAAKSWNFSSDEAWSIYSEIYAGKNINHHQKNFEDVYNN